MKEFLRIAARGMNVRFMSVAFMAALVFATPEFAHANIGDCILNPVNCGAQAGLTVILTFITPVVWLIFKIATLILGFAGVVFNQAMLYVVFEFSTYLGNSEGLLLAWSIMRDFANIGLLFAFVFLGIATILDLHSYPWKKTLPRIIMFAILLNFSLFITQAVIDVTNSVSVALYKTTSTNSCTDGQTSTECALNTGVAGAVLEQLQMPSVFLSDASNQATIEGIVQHFQNPVGNIMKFFMLALVVTIVATVLFAAASMIISRAIVLAILMITSPIGFAGLVIPGLEKIAKDWWDKLISQSLFAPVFLLLLFAGLKMTEGLATLGEAGGGLASAVETINVVDAGPIFMFLLVIGFFVAALMIASRFGIYASDWAIKTAGGLTYGTLGALGRRTVGRWSNQQAQRLAASGKTTGFLGRNLMRAATYGATASFNARALSPVKAGAKAVGLDLGKPSKDAQGGARGVQKAKGELANKDAKARKDEWAAQDKFYEQKGEDLQNDLKRAVAYEDLYRQKFEKTGDKKYEKLADKYKAQILAIEGDKKKEAALKEELETATDEERRREIKAELNKQGGAIGDNAREWQAAKIRRTTDGDKVVRQYLENKEDEADQVMRYTKRTMVDPAEAELKTSQAENRAATEAATAAAEAAKAAKDAADAAREVLAEKREELKFIPETAVREKEEAERLVDEAERAQVAAEARETETARAKEEAYAAQSAAALRQTAAEKALKVAAIRLKESTAVRKDKTDQLNKFVTRTEDSKYAMDQIVEAYQRMAAGPLAYDREQLRSMAAAVRKTRGKSEMEETFEHLEHLIAHGKEGHDDHGGDAGHAKPKAGGGGAAKADAHDDHH